MLPDVAQKVDQSLRAEPFRIVEQDGGGGPGAELEKARHLIALVLQVVTDLFFRKQRPLACFAGWIADQSGATTHQHDRPVPAALQIGEQHQRHEIAKLQRRRRGIEAAVGGDRPLGEMRGEAGRRLLDEPAPLELL